MVPKNRDVQQAHNSAKDLNCKFNFLLVITNLKLTRSYFSEQYFTGWVIILIVY